MTSIRVPLKPSTGISGRVLGMTLQLCIGTEKSHARANGSNTHHGDCGRKAGGTTGSSKRVLSL